MTLTWLFIPYITTMIHVYLIIQHQLLCVALLIFHELSSSAPWEVSPLN